MATKIIPVVQIDKFDGDMFFLSNFLVPMKFLFYNIWNKNFTYYETFVGYIIKKCLK